MMWYDWGLPYSPLRLSSRLTSCPSYSASISSMARRSSSPAGSSLAVRAGVASASGTKWVLRSEMGSTNPVLSRSVAVGLESEEDTEDSDFALRGTVAGGVLSSIGARHRPLGRGGLSYRLTLRLLAFFLSSPPSPRTVGVALSCRLLLTLLLPTDDSVTACSCLLGPIPEQIEVDPRRDFCAGRCPLVLQVDGVRLHTFSLQAINEGPNIMFL